LCRKAHGDPYLSAVSITLSSRMLPPGWTINSAPLLYPCAHCRQRGRKRRTTVTPLRVEIHSFFFGGCQRFRPFFKNVCHTPSAVLSSCSSEIYTSIALSLSGRRWRLKIAVSGPWGAGADTSYRPCRRPGGCSECGSAVRHPRRCLPILT
jgi:hypothetical protein